MSLTASELTPADIRACTSDNNNGFGGDGLYGIIVLFILMAMLNNGGFGFGGFGGFGGAAAMGMADGAMLYPWMNQLEATQAGFAGQATNAAIQGVQNAVTTGFGDTALGIAGINQNICQTGNGIVNAMNSGFANAESSANARQMANMQQAFNAQTAMTQGLNAISSQFADCCCENRLANCQTQNIIQNEGNATRFADANNTRDLLTAFNSGIQSLKDQLCDYRNEQKDDTIAQLRSELMYARGQASQDIQTAAIQAGQRALANEVEQYVNPTPIPSYTVANPNCCVNPCGCNGGF